MNVIRIPSNERYLPLPDMISQRQLFLQHVAQTSPFPPALEIVKAEGCVLTDIDKKTYIDLIAGISVSNVGHRHPKVVAAIKDQVDRYMHLMVYGEYVISPQVQLAKRLAELLPAPLDCTYFVNSGAEAVEGAMKLAKRFTGRTEIIGFEKAYHGSTQGALSLMGAETYRNAFRPLLPDVRHLKFNDGAALDQITEKTAAVFAEPVQGEAGAIVPQPGFLKALRQRCTETGALLVFDEIQTGLGRTGSLFAFEQEKVIPDIVLLAKGLGGGLPIGAFIAPQRIMQCLTENPMLGHITTFGGNPVCCAAALATLNLVAEEKLYEGVAEREQIVRDTVKHPSIREIRGRGLLLAVELGDRDRCLAVVTECMQRGVITDWFLFCDTALRIAPPLTMAPEQLQYACEIIVQALEAVGR